MVEILQTYQCESKDTCDFKRSGMRCGAKYRVRQSCRYIVREDGKSWSTGSRLENAKVTIDEHKA